MNLRRFESLDDLAHAAAREIARRAGANASVESGQPFRVALSGGSTPEPIYALLGRPPLRDALAGRRVDWIVGDERCVPPDDPESNAGMIGRTLFAQGVSDGHRFLRFRTELVDPAAIASDFEAQWKALGIERLDLAIQGIGEDGHTASLFPGTTALAVTGRVATEVWVPRLASWRVTLTLPVLQQSRGMLVLAAGAAKHEVIAAIRRGATDYPIVPVTEAVEDCWWLTDQAAAGESAPLV